MRLFSIGTLLLLFLTSCSSKRAQESIIKQECPPNYYSANEKELIEEGIRMDANQNPGAANWLFSQAIKLNPKNAENYNRRGLTYGLQSDYQRGILDFQKAISLDSSVADYHMNLGFYLWSGARQVKEAIPSLSKAIQLDPENASYYYTRSGAYYSINKMEESLVDIMKSIELEPENGQFYHSRALILLKGNEKDLACKDFATAKKFGYQNVNEVLVKACQ